MQTPNKTERMKKPGRTYVYAPPLTVHEQGGFTLVELMIVMVIVAILMSIGISGFATFKEYARISRAKVEIRGMEREIGAWATEKGTLPPSLSDIKRENQHDPWGHNYVYSPPIRMAGGDLINSDFDLYSNGPNGGTVVSIIDDLSLDDIIRGRDGSFVSMAKEY